MPLRPHDYRRPSDIDSALNLLRQEFTKPILIGPRPEPDPYSNTEIVVDLSGLRLDGIFESEGRIHIGAQATLQSLIESPRLETVANGILPEAARLAAHPGLRNVATVGGALLTRESPPEILLALLALDASVVIAGPERRTLPLTRYQPDQNDLVLEVIFDWRSAVGAALARVARSPLDAAIVAAVAVVAPDSARVAVAGASARPILKFQSLRDASDLQSLSDSVASEARPIPDYRGSAEYRKAMAGVLAIRALTDAAKRAGL